MFKLLKKHSKLNEFILLVAMSVFCIGLSVFRCFYTKTFTYLFLNWNLILAFIPWILSSSLLISNKLNNYPIYKLLVILLWMAFFPNAPYILTDLFHITVLSNMPLWFDLLLVLSFAWTGLFLGVLSLMDMEKYYTKFIKQRWLNVLIFSFLFLGSYGVYVGRFLRWNSWDIVSEPKELLRDLFQNILYHQNVPNPIVITFILGILLNIMFWSFRLLKMKNENVLSK